VVAAAVDVGSDVVDVDAPPHDPAMKAIEARTATLRATSM
jgi:hypothetical protein